MTLVHARPDRLLQAAARTDAGCLRVVNEDAVLVRTGGSPDASSFCLLALVADGMGGHGHGDLASRLALNAAAERFFATDGEPSARLTAALEEANARVFARANEDSVLAGMGTTCAAVAIEGSSACCAHVGDSRVYLVRGGRAYRQTQDDSVVQRLVSNGHLTQEDARASIPSGTSS